MDISKGGRGGLIVNTASLAGIGVGLTRSSACYFVAKHGVVSLTRTLGAEKNFKETGVKVQCICPSFAETGILSDLEGDSKSLIEKKIGIMTAEYVADAFIKLVTKCKNGAAVVV